MTDLPLRLGCADYARVLPLAAGQVRAEGIALDLVLGRDGSWPMRASLLSRAVSDPELDGGEGSMAQHVRRVAIGDRSHVGIPVFVLRGFLHRDLYVRRNGPVRTPADLRGKRVGMYSWAASGSIWYRQAQQEMGVPVDSVHWVIGDIEGASLAPAGDLPPGVQAAPPGRTIAEMLAKGELDAMWSPPRPRLYHPVHGPLARLFSDFASVERDYWTRHRFWPAMHLLILRRAVWQANPWIGGALVDAFDAAEAQFEASQRGFPVGTPWQEAVLEQDTLLMGEGYWRHGVEPNRAMLDVFCATAHQLGLTARRVSVDEYFAEYLESGGR
jgi:4,5-dihydroxyphthalate decarboxylase